MESGGRFESSDINVNATIGALLEQFTRSLQATVSLTQSMQSLQSEVVRHGVSLTSYAAEMMALREKVMSLTHLVQGEGMSDSLYKSLIKMDAQLAALEKFNTDRIENVRERARTSFPWQIAWWSIGASFVTMLLSIILSPIIVKWFAGH